MRLDSEPVRGWILVLAAVLAMPTAAAAHVSGALRIEGAVVLPRGATLTSQPVALFAADLGSLARFDAHAARAHVELYERTFVEASLAQQVPRVVTGSGASSWDLTDVNATVETPAFGWLGAHVLSGTLQETVLDSGDVTARTNAVIGNQHVAQQDDTSETPAFQAEATGTSLARTTSDWAFQGAASFKLMGANVTLRSRENTTTLETGTVRDPERPGETTERWLVLTLDDADVRSTGAATAVLSPGADAAWDGPATLDDATGTLASALQTWTAEERTVTLDGSLRAALGAGSSGDIHADLQGDLRSATMTSAARVPTAAGQSPWLPLALVVGLAIASAGGWVLARQRRPARASLPAAGTAAVATVVGADEYALLAERAADAEDYELAAAYAKQARALSPTSRRLALDHAYYEAERGARDDAWRALEDPLLRDDPDAALLAMRLHLDEGREDAAAERLVRALELAPLTLLDVERDPATERLLARPEVRAAVERARRMLG
jgi:hypothetical protein